MEERGRYEHNSLNANTHTHTHTHTHSLPLFLKSSDSLPFYFDLSIFLSLLPSHLFWAFIFLSPSTAFLSFLSPLLIWTFFVGGGAVPSRIWTWDQPVPLKYSNNSLWQWALTEAGADVMLSQWVAQEWVEQRNWKKIKNIKYFKGRCSFSFTGIRSWKHLWILLR